MLNAFSTAMPSEALIAAAPRRRAWQAHAAVISCEALPAIADGEPARRRRADFAMSLIRACAPEDMPAVAGLFQRTFLDRRKPAPKALESYLAELFLRHPWHDPEIASRVYVSPEGAVRGFIGVLPLRLCFRGRSVRAAVAGSLMVESPEENPLAGARLLRSFAKGPQEL